jgi:hypothetical protein
MQMARFELVLSLCKGASLAGSRSAVRTLPLKFACPVYRQQQDGLVAIAVLMLQFPIISKD